MAVQSKLIQNIDFKNAYYVKLGEGGKWEESSIRENKVRIGWINWSLEEINQRKWIKLKQTHRKEFKNEGSATKDLNALKTIVESAADDIWITFYARQLWWCRVGAPRIFKDKTSNFRKVHGKWRNQDIDGNRLIINQIPGIIEKKQGFRGTICGFDRNQVECLKRLLNNQPSETFQKIYQEKIKLIEEVEKGLKGLLWKDFEVLVDLVFRNAGWRRLSLLGGQMKTIDMELEEPITGDLYQVQVKSAANLEVFKESVRTFSPRNFRKFYFVVHSPQAKLVNYQSEVDEKIELILPKRLAEMIVDLGLTNWLLKKIR